MAEICGIGDVLDSLSSDLVATGGYGSQPDSLAFAIALNWDQESRKSHSLLKIGFDEQVEH